MSPRKRVVRPKTKKQNKKQNKGGVVLRGDIVKDDSGAFAFFTEQGSSPSQMTAGKVMDLIARLPDCDGQAADAVSAYTQVKLEDAPRLLRIPKSECPDVLIRLPRHTWPKSWANIEDPVVLLERNLYGHPFAGLLWEIQFEETLLKLGWEKYRIGKVFFVHRKQGLFLSIYVDDFKSLNRSRIWLPCGRKWWKMLIFMNPHHFLIAFFWDALNVNVNRTIEYREMFESRISAGATEKLAGWATIFAQKQSRGRTTWKDMLENALRDIASWQTKKRSSFSQFQVLSWMFTNSWRKNLNQLENYQKVCSHIVLTCLYSARIGRPDFLWSVNKLARAVTKWSQSCDRRLARLISYIHHTNDYRQYCHVGNTAQHCRLGLFQDSDFAGNLVDSKSTSEWLLSIFGSRTLVPICWMYKKQTSVAHSSTESEII